MDPRIICILIKFPWPLELKKPQIIHYTQRLACCY